MTINRTQALVLGFFVVVWATLVVLLAASKVYYRVMNLSSAGVGLLFLLGISAFISLLGVGVLRRWTFWLIAGAFLFGVLRVPVTFLTLEGALPADGPPWYVVYQGFLGVVQFVIALFMLVGYRRAGTLGGVLKRSAVAPRSPQRGIPSLLLALFTRVRGEAHATGGKRGGYTRARELFSRVGPRYHARTGNPLTPHLPRGCSILAPEQPSRP